jgi:lipopolysaccharide exporter
MATTLTLRQRAVRSAAWTVPTSVGSRAVGLLGTLLLARYLAPDEYGVVMAAAIAAATASSITTFGVGIYLVSNATLSRAETFHASCWFLATGVAALIVTMMLGGPVGRWSGAPGLAAFLPVLLVATLLERIFYVPERILVRQLRFGALSVGRAAGELTFTFVAVILAAHGTGGMAIAWGSLARSAVRFITVVPAVDVRDWLEPHRLHLATFLRIVGYGLNVSVASIVAFGIRRWDNLLISRYYGAAAMGAYNYAYNLADTPATAIGDQLSDIVAAAFPQVDQRRRAEALVHACTMVSLIMLPLSVGLATVAPTVVETFFDPRWSNVGTMLMVLSALSVARPLTGILASYFFASQRPAVVLWIECAGLIGLVAVMSTLGRFGLNWACAGVGSVFILRTLAAMWVVSRQDGVRMSAFLLPMVRPLLVCVAMVAGVNAARLALGVLSSPIQLLAEITLGAAIYGAGAWLVARASCQELLSAARSVLGRRHAAVTAASPVPGVMPRVLSLSTEFPNPTEPGKGLFVRARLQAIASRASLFVVSPVALLDYANPERKLFAALRIPRATTEGELPVLHPRWLYPPRGGWTNAFFLFARLLPMVTGVRRRRPFDVIDAHFAHPEGIAAVLLGRILRCAVLVTLRGSELRYQDQRLKRFWMSWALRRADRVIAVSDGLRDLAVDLGVDPRRVRTVPNGIADDVFFPRDRQVCRSRHGIGPAERIILSAGDLAELKGHHRVIAAVSDLNAQGMRVRLLIAGGIGRSGRYAETLRQQVEIGGLEDQVLFLGEKSQPALAELMSAADVFCLASSSEGWPNVVNEALACGTPVVATDVGAVRQMLVSDRYGAVVRVDDRGGLAGTLRAAVTRQWDHAAISAWGRSRSWHQVAEDVLEEMQAALTERSCGHAGRSRLDAADTMRPAAALRSRFVGLGRS